jgi:hypothetical protein
MTCVGQLNFNLMPYKSLLRERNHQQLLMRIFARARASSKNLSPAGAQNPTQKNEIFSPQKITGLGIAHAAES